MQEINLETRHCILLCSTKILKCAELLKNMDQMLESKTTMDYPPLMYVT